eukprot:CCRYP_015998-RA/>CCRYP_015998-RA protein AED:0.36 eAED:0.36 QI:0/0.66/0.75/1/0/0/4/605/96
MDSSAYKEYREPYLNQMVYWSPPMEPSNFAKVSFSSIASAWKDGSTIFLLASSMIFRIARSQPMPFDTAFALEDADRVPIAEGTQYSTLMFNDGCS